MQNADHFIVVISQNALNSKWIVRELSSYLTANPEATILPVVIEEVNMAEIYKGLEEYKAIPFYKDMLSGFVELLSFFDKEFLPIKDRRGYKDRRSAERRKFYDRRKSPIIQRLRKGFWKCYAAETGMGPFDDFHLLPSHIIKISDILTSEFKRYEYFDSDGNQLQFDRKKFDKIIYEVCEDMSSRENMRPIYLIESIAERVHATFDQISPIMRRVASRRQGQNRRQN